MIARVRVCTITDMITTKGTTMTTDYIKERGKVLLLVDRLVVIELGDDWTLDAHMKRTAAILQILDREEGNK